MALLKGIAVQIQVAPHNARAKYPLTSLDAEDTSIEAIPTFAPNCLIFACQRRGLYATNL